RRPEFSLRRYRSGLGSSRQRRPWPRELGRRTAWRRWWRRRGRGPFRGRRWRSRGRRWWWRRERTTLMRSSAWQEADMRTVVLVDRGVSRRPWLAWWTAFAILLLVAMPT